MVSLFQTSMFVFVLFFKFWQEEGDAHHEEDDKKTGDVDEKSLSILFPIFLVGPDSFLQVSHEGGGSGQPQDAGAEVLVERQEQSPDVSGELGEQECQEPKSPL